MHLDKDKRLVLEKDEAVRLITMADNMMKAADLNGLKDDGFIVISDTFIVDEVALLLNIAKMDQETEA